MNDALLACPDCGQLHRAAPGLFFAHRLGCVRCGGELARRPPGGLDAPLALVTAAMILLLLVNAYPIFELNLHGREAQDLLVSGALRFTDYGIGFAGLGTLVGALTFGVPAVWYTLLAVVLAMLRWGPPHWHPRIAGPWKAAALLYPWSMLDVFLLAIYVAYTRLADAVETTVGIGGYALGALVVVQTLLVLMVGRQRIWHVLGDGRRYAPRPGEPWVMCGACHLVLAPPPPAPGDSVGCCPRCAEPLEPRRPGNLSGTVALILAGAILYIPANILPIMTVVQFGRVQTYTILSGIEELARLELWPLVILVFFASIVVPIAKLAALAWFLAAIRLRSARGLRLRTSLYRLIDFVGRWSNIDVFMVSIVAASLRFGSLTRIDPEPGIISFAAVVILTMLATARFDPRLMWDAVQETGRGETR